ncbi:hypothetical protein HOLleu_35208 [Holothuria leucospilota]|uniref:Uncharacterized protein n=1 Tax=Holothuria leucospilota TaxID=206669 RepID=A0A9Q1BHL7_HOLLE|nr:hypothetical protein HOLleu_35208 [Holothuria leucospilota]
MFVCHLGNFHSRIVSPVRGTCTFFGDFFAGNLVVFITQKLIATYLEKNRKISLHLFLCLNEKKEKKSKKKKKKQREKEKDDKITKRITNMRRIAR